MHWGIVPCLVDGLIMLEFMQKMFDYSGFMPRWNCGNWSPTHGWLHILSDLATWGAYTAIPIALIYFVRKRSDVPFHRIFVLFGLFILACGTTHLIEAIIFWIPIYPLAGLVKIITAVVSWATFIALVQILPEAIKLPGIMKLNDQLRQEIMERQRGEKERESLLIREQTARADAERASRMKDDFLSTVSHEIRTPLNAILGWAQILRQPGVSSAEIEQGMEVIERNSRTQAKIIDDLLDMSRIVAGKIKLDIQPVDLAHVIRTAVETVQPAAAAKEIDLVADLQGPLVGLVGDPSRLQQVMWNLLSNAIKFTPKGGTIRVAATRLESQFEISVRDSGIGIEPDFLEHVFDRFSQADVGSTRRYGGLGLGLSIVKQLVELHGGTVRATSAGVGQGATFAIHLPVRSLHAEETAELSGPRAGQDSAPHMNLAGVRALVVDDELDARELVRRVLVSCGADVTTASTAEEALQILAAKNFEVLISDIGMPGKDGYFLIRSVREGGGETPAIALTAFARSEDRRNALLAGFQSHISKPAEPAELAAVVASLTGRLKR